ncbi:hypothetical protein [Hyphomonas sp.]|uniref:hypothetical protein n=1 Tax=Hyphomonas sp. TaxID=87 RepID=UPI003F71867F
MITRRKVLLAGAASTTAFAAVRGAIAQEDDDQAVLNALFEDDMEPLPSTAPRSVRAARSTPKFRALKWSRMPDPKPKVEWFDDSKSVNYRHIEAEFSSSEFELTAEVLQTLADWNSIELPALKTVPLAPEDEAWVEDFMGKSQDPVERVLFGLRGCELAEQKEAPSGLTAEPIRVREAHCDHVHLRCLIGVWDRESGKIWASQASTVPNADYMLSQTTGAFDRRCNMLPTGRHRYVVGPHRGGTSSRQPGAFRLASSVCVQRSLYNLGYALGDYWDVSLGNPFDNIHAGVLDTFDHPLDYSSAGCQVLPGSYDESRKTPLGAWATFRSMAGLEPVPVFKTGSIVTTTDDGREFDYLLMTGREARLAASPGAVPVRRIRLGSSGAAIPTLRQKLGVPTYHEIDGEAMKALLIWQQEFAGFADGILTPSQQILLEA